MLEMAKTKKKKNKKSKGFGNQPSPSSDEESSSSSSPSAADTMQSMKEQEIQTQQEIQQQTMTGGAEALAKLRRAEAEKRNDELRAIRELKSVDSQLQQNPSSAAIPEQVAMRMGKRMLPFVGIPLFGLMGTFVLFWYLATYKGMEFQPALVAFSTVGVLGVGLLGITYSVISASWDPEEEGSLLGVDEFKTNVGNIQDGLKRSRENLVLREKMAGLPEDEIQRAIDNLDRKEQRDKEKKLDLKSRLEKELE